MVITAYWKDISSSLRIHELVAHSKTGIGMGSLAGNLGAKMSPLFLIILKTGDRIAVLGPSTASIWKEEKGINYTLKAGFD